jgi:hypothetical protein
MLSALKAMGICRKNAGADTRIIVYTNKQGTLPIEPMIGNVYGIHPKKN